MLALDFAGVVSFIMWIFNFIILAKYILCELKVEIQYVIKNSIYLSSKFYMQNIFK
jgi:hypothetical protein